MTRKNSAEETIHYSLFRRKKSSALGEIQQKVYVPYKLALFLADILLICLAFVFGAWMSGYQFNLSNHLQQSVILISFSVIAGSFFLTYDLYNYHLIFFIKNHNKRFDSYYSRIVIQRDDCAGINNCQDII